MPDTSPKTNTQPNIVLILADDMGFADIGCYGSEIRTPNLDALAGGGMRLTQMYNCARCCPTRASMLTGLYPHKAGVGHMVRNCGVGPAYQGHLEKFTFRPRWSFRSLAASQKTAEYDPICTIFCSLPESENPTRYPNLNCSKYPQGYLRDETVTFAEALAPAGYQRLYSGKWHCGGHYLPHESEKWAPGSSGYPYPLSRGFEKFFGTVSGAGSFFRPHTLMEQDQFVTDEEYFSDFYYTDAISDHACEMIRQADADRPLLLHTCYTAPHWPLHALEEDIAKYEAAYGVGWDELRGRRLEEMKSLGLLPEKWQLSPRDSAPPWDELDARRREWDAMRMAVYAAQIDRMDQGIGQIIAALKETGRWENTLVIFLADNGGCAEFLAEDGFIQHYDQVPPGCGPMQVGNRPELRPGPADTFMSYDTPWANASNTPFRLYKHWVHEGGISTPAICHWPGEIPAGTIRHQPCHIVDLMATFLDVGQAQYPTQKASRATPDLDGVTLAPLLRGQESWQRGRPIFFEHEGNRAIRDGQWKLVSRTVENRTELCDLAPRDPGRATRMARDYDAWATRADVLPWNQGPQPRG